MRMRIFVAISFSSLQIVRANLELKGVWMFFSYWFRCSLQQELLAFSIFYFHSVWSLNLSHAKKVNRTIKLAPTSLSFPPGCFLIGPQVKLLLSPEMQILSVGSGLFERSFTLSSTRTQLHLLQNLPIIITWYSPSSFFNQFSKLTVLL